MARKSENKQSSELFKPLMRKGWWVRKMHGNIYQPGILDYQLCRPCDGMFMALEMKQSASKRNEYLQLDVIAMLKGAQVGTFKQLITYHARVGIVLLTPSGIHFVRPPLKLQGPAEQYSSDTFLEALEEW